MKTDKEYQFGVNIPNPLPGSVPAGTVYKFDGHVYWLTGPGSLDSADKRKPKYRGTFTERGKNNTFATGTSCAYPDQIDWSTAGYGASAPVEYCESCGSAHVARKLDPALIAHRDVADAPVCNECDNIAFAHSVFNRYEQLVNRIRARRLAVHGVKPDSVFPSVLLAGDVEWVLGGDIHEYTFHVDALPKDGDYICDSWRQRGGLPSTRSCRFSAHGIDWSHYYQSRYGAPTEEYGITIVAPESVPVPHPNCLWCEKPIKHNDHCSAVAGYALHKSSNCAVPFVAWKEQCATDGTNPLSLTDYDRGCVTRRLAIVAPKAQSPVLCSDRMQPSNLDKRIAKAIYEVNPNTGTVWATSGDES